MRQRESAVPARVVASAIKPNAPAKGGPKHSGWLLRIPLTRSHGKTQEGGNRERPSACCLERSMKDCRRCPQRPGGFSGGREPESRIRRVADKCIDGSAQANARTSAFLCGPPCLGRRQRRPFLASGQPPSALRHLPGILPQAQLTAGKQGQDVGGLVRPALFHAGPKLQAGFLRIAAFSLGIRPQVVEIEATAANQRRYRHRRHPQGNKRTAASADSCGWRRACGSHACAAAGHVIAAARRVANCGQACRIQPSDFIAFTIDKPDLQRIAVAFLQNSATCALLRQHSVPACIPQRAYLPRTPPTGRLTLSLPADSASAPPPFARTAPRSKPTRASAHPPAETA